MRKRRSPKNQEIRVISNSMGRKWKFLSGQNDISFEYPPVRDFEPRKKRTYMRPIHVVKGENKKRQAKKIARFEEEIMRSHYNDMVNTPDEELFTVPKRQQPVRNEQFRERTSRRPVNKFLTVARDNLDSDPISNNTGSSNGGGGKRNRRVRRKKRIFSFLSVEGAKKRLEKAINNEVYEKELDLLKTYTRVNIITVPSYQSLHPVHEIKEIFTDFPTQLVVRGYKEDKNYTNYRNRLNKYMEAERSQRIMQAEGNYKLSPPMKKQLNDMVSTKKFKQYLLRKKAEIPEWMEEN